MNTNGAIELSYAIIEQAVKDAQQMMANKLMQTDGTSTTNERWPKRRANTVSGINTQNKLFQGLSKPHQVSSLVTWLMGDAGHLSLDMLLTECGSGLTARDVCVGLGLDYQAIKERTGE